MKKHIVQSAVRRTDRTGATLVEVLMSLLVMSIGLVSVATLFPLSVQRSLSATKLTNATILSYNVRAAIDVLPQNLVHNPDGRANPATHNNTNYIVDPWGANEVGGNFGPVARYNGLFNTAGRARDFVCLPDSWVDIVTTPITANTATSVTVPGSIDLTAVPIDEDADRSGTINGGETDINGDGVANDTPSRVVLFDILGRQSAVRTITGITGQTISWSTSEPLPAGYDVGRVRIEQFEPRYSWLLTVRKTSSGIASVDIVVFFRRSLSTLDETAYNATYNPTLRVYTVTTGGAKPYWKKGGYLFDTDNCRWLRIQKINENTGEVVIEGSPRITDTQTQVMFPRGVVDVYPIGNKVP